MADLTPPPDLVDPNEEGFVSDIRNVGERSADTAVSPKGAVSAMQVMPPTEIDPGFGVAPAQNASLEEADRVGQDYARALFKHYGNRTLAAAAYNAGPGRVDQWIRQFGDPRSGSISDADFVDKIPVAETKGYAGRLLAANTQPAADLQSPPADLVSAPAASQPPPDLMQPPPDLVAAVQPPPDLIAPDPTAMGAFGRGAARGALPAAGGLAGFGAGAEAGALVGAPISAFAGPLAPVVEAIITLGAGAAGAYFGADVVGKAQQWMLDHAPAVRKATGQDAAQQQEDTTKHPYAAFAGELAPNLALLRPTTAIKELPEILAPGQAPATATQRLLAHPLTARATGATVMGAQEAGQEEYQSGHVDPAKVAIAAGAGALMNKQTALGEKISGLGAGPVRAAANMFGGRRASPPVGDTIEGDFTERRPPAGLVGSPGKPSGPSGPGSGGGAAKPSGLAPGTEIGLPFPDGTVRGATVMGSPAEGVIRLKYDDGSVVDHVAAEIQHDAVPHPGERDIPPQPVYRGPQLSQEERAAPPLEESEPVPPSQRTQDRIRRPTQPQLDPQAIHALDLAGRLETAALDPTVPMSTADRQAALMQAARLRQSFGHEGGTAPESYRHPMAGEPAADLGQLATSRTVRPDLYQQPYEAIPIAKSKDVSQETLPPEVPKRPQDLLQFLGSKGGINGNDPYTAGDLQAMDAHRKFLPGTGMLVRQTGGMPLDKAREAAAEYGYGRDYNNFETVDDLMDAIRDSMRGKDVFSESEGGGYEQAQAWRDYKSGQNQPPEVENQAVNKTIDDLRQQADHYGVQYGEDWSAEDLLAAVTEREAMRAENAGGDQPQNLADALELNMDYYLAARHPQVYGDMRDEGVAEEVTHEGQPPAQPEEAAGVGARGPEVGGPSREEVPAESRGSPGESGAPAPAPASPQDVAHGRQTTRPKQNTPLQNLAERGRSLQESEQSSIPQLRRPRSETASAVGEEIPGVSAGRGTATERSAHTGEKEQQRELRSGQRDLGHTERTGAEYAQEPVADIQGTNTATGGVGGGSRAGAVNPSVPTQSGHERRRSDQHPKAGRASAKLQSVEIAGQLGDVNVKPSAAQIAAGNYKKAHINFQGLPVTIENPAGSERRGIASDGKPWSVTLQHPYGYVKGTKGADGEHVDVYIGPHEGSPDVFIVDQKDPKTGAWDEHKAILGARTEEEAREIYNGGFSDGSGPARLGAITAMPIDEFRAWLNKPQPEPITHVPVAPEPEDFRQVARDLGLAVPRGSSEEEVTGMVALRQANLTPDAYAGTVRDNIEEAIDRQARESLPEVFDEQGWSEGGAGRAVEEQAQAGRPDEDVEQPGAARTEEEGRASAPAEPAGGGHSGGEGAAPPVPQRGPKVTENKERNGVEVRFDARPTDDVIGKLKAAGFRWSRPQKLWYAKRSDRTMAAANALKGEPERTFRTTPGAIAMEHAAEVSSLETEGSIAAAAKHTPTALIQDQGAAQAARAEMDASEYQPAAMPITAAAPPPKKPAQRDLFSIGDEVAPKPENVSALLPRDGPRYVTDVSQDGRQVTLDGGAVLPARDIEPISGHGLQKPIRPSAAGSRSETVPRVGEDQANRSVPAGEKSGSPQAAGRPSGRGAEGSGRPAERPAGPAHRRGAGEVADVGIPRPRERSASGAAGRPDDAVKGVNFAIEPGAVAEGRGPKAKAADNLSAIRLAKRLIQEDRPATREEQSVLAKYVGWGGLSGAFENSQGKYGTGFEDVGRDLKELLTPEEYRTAARSTQYAHYTAENVIRSMWDAVSAMGFKGGNVFEPGMGVGHFLGMMPPDIAENSQYQGIELDHLTADIAKLLYPQSGVRQADFTETPLPDNTFDLVIGNPPFSDTVIKGDPKYAARGFMLHDYFFAKSMDAVRPGGILGFVTSAGTMNKLHPDAREYLGQRAEFLGGIRLPSNAFKKNAGTEVTTDILFFKKRDEPLSPPEFRAAPDKPWTETVQRSLPNADGGTTKGNVSRYFSEHPEQVLGKEGFFDKLYKDRYAVHAPEGADLTDNIQAALARLPKDIYQPEETPQHKAEMDFAAPERKDGSFYLQDGRLMQYSDGVGRPVAKRAAGVEGGFPAPAMERIAKLVPIRDALRDVFAHDLADRPQDAAAAREALNRAYDAFVQKFGPINKAEFQYRCPNIIQQESARAEAREQARDRGEPWREGNFDGEQMFRAGSSMQEVARARATAREAAGAGFDEGSFNPTEMPDIVIDKRPNIDPFMDDQESYRLRSIENYNDATGEHSKKRIFFESVLTREQEPQLNSANDGVLWSLNKFGRLDLDKIAGQMGRDKHDVITELGNAIFRLPNTEGTYQTSDEYLSGDIPDKIAIARAAAQHDADMRRNVEALEAAMPAPLAPSEISMTLGMPWIPPEHVEQFARDHLKIGDARIRHNAALGRWTVNPITNGSDTAKWGTDARPPFQIMSDALNRTPPRIYTEHYIPGEGKKREFDPVATQAAQDKYDAIRAAFGDWVDSDNDRKDKLATIYNDKLNRTVLRKFDGSYLTTPGISSEWRWRPHQQRVVARVVQAGNTYIAHAVGAGKTSEAIGAGMEMRRLGLVKKPMYAVPNHMLAQFTKEFYEQYPTARIAVADERRFHTDRRKQFIANVAQDDLDAVIITHSAFGKIPISHGFQKELINEELDHIHDALDGLDKQDDRITIKRLENQKEKLEQQLKGAFSAGKDKTNTFEEMGIDHLFVDEAHQFRKLSFATRQSSLKGITPEGSGMAWDLYSKIRYLESKNPGRSAVLMSGTPVTNTMGELYTISRYLQRQELQSRGIDHFDSWAATSGDTKSSLEQTPDGGYAPVTRFARFVNIPELYKMVGGIMDIVTPHQLDQFVVRPKLKDGKRAFNLAPKTALLENYQERLAKRMRDIKARKGPPKPGDDIMLSVINDGRHASIDMRFVDPFAPNDKNSKLNQMIENVHRIWKQTRDTQFYDPRSNYQKPTARGPATQMVFANLGIGDGGGEKFSGYAWMKRELIRRGVPPGEIAFIRDHKSHVARQKLFNDMNEGKIRILIGSTQKMGTGVNAQKRLYAIHNQDPLWFPADDEQRVGRGLRQGNMNPEIEVHDYSTKGTYDATMWQMMGRKGRFIEQFFRGDPELRDMEDLGEASQYEQASAIATSDPRVMELTDLRQQLDKAQRRGAAHDREQYSMRSRLSDALSNIGRIERGLPVVEADITQRVPTAGDAFKMKVGNKTYGERGEAMAALRDLYGDIFPTMDKDQERKVGELGGFEIYLVKEGLLGKRPVFYIKRSNGDLSELGADTPAGVIRSAESRLTKFEGEIDYLNRQKDEAQRQVASLRAQVGKPFTGGEEIQRLKGQVKDLEASLAPKKEEPPKPGSQVQAQVEKPLTEAQFYRQYAQHVDLRGRADGTALKNREAIMRDGFKKGFNVNAVPPFRGGEPTNITERDFGKPKVGDVVYLAPREAWKAKGNGIEIQNGWVPKPYESFVVTDPNRSMYENYLDAFRQSAPDVQAQVEKPFYSALTRGVDNIKQERAPAGQWLGIIDNLPGVKREEIDWSGVKDWLAEQKGPVTKAALSEFMRANEVQVREVEHEENTARPTWTEIPAEPTKFKQYTLPGGENYRELLLTLPEKEGGERGPKGWGDSHGGTQDTANFRSTHFDEPNILAHVRFDDRTGPNGEKVLHVAEIQSDWGQRLRKSSALRAVAKPQSVRELSENVLGREMASAVPLEHMNGGVLAALHHDQVARAVAASLPIDVVNDLRAAKSSPEELLRNPDVVIARVPADHRGWVARAVLSGARRVSATLRTKLYESFAAGRDEEILPAMRASDLSAREVVGLLATESLYHAGLHGGAANLRETSAGAENSPLASGIGREHPKQLPATEAAFLNTPLSARRATETGGSGPARLNGEVRPASIASLLDWHNRIISEAGTGKPVRYEATDLPKMPLEKNWHELALKRTLRYAAENGYDRLSWDTGETQADRYDLSKSLSQIIVHPEKGPNGSTRYDLTADDKQGTQVIHKTLDKPEDAVEIVGKEAAEKLFSGENKERLDAGAHAHLSGLDLKVGGEGMKGFYDKILPTFLNKYAKKWGAKVEDTTLSRATARPGGIGEELAVRTGEKSVPVHSIPITDAMRESVMQGQPMFHRGPGGDVATGNRGFVPLSEHVAARLPTIPDQREAQILEQVGRLMKQIVPTAKVIPAQELTVSHEASGAAGLRTWGATFVDGPRRVIAWSLAAPDALGTASHEAIHYLRNTGFFSPREWETLSKAAKDGGWLKKHNIAVRYPDLDAGLQNEEAIADEFSQWRTNQVKPEAPVRRLFARIRELLNRTARYLKSLFGANATAEDIFRGIASGEVGNRPVVEPVFGPEVQEQAERTPDGPPETPQEGRDYIDQTAEDLADHIKGQGPGTYARELQRLSPPSGPEYHLRANWLQQHVMGPRTVAEIDTKSGRFWQAIKAEEDEGQKRLTDLRGHIEKTFLKLPRESQDHVNAVMELDRLDGRTREDDGRQIVARNSDHEFAHGSKPAEQVILSPKETKAYFELQKMYRSAWDNIMEGAARRMGWQRAWSPAMADNMKLIERAMEEANDNRTRKAFARLHDVMEAMEAQRRAAYMPLMRFGDYYISVKPKEGTDTDRTGGFPPSARFELAERPSMQFSDIDPGNMLRGEVTKTGQVPDYAQARIAELGKRFPPAKYRIESGYLMNKPEALRSIGIPAIEKLMTLMESGVMSRLKADAAMGGFANKAAAREAADQKYKDLFDELVDAVHDEMYEQLKAGFKKRSNTVPGYSGDWNRVLGSYMNWTTRHVANQIHSDNIERIYNDIQTSHPHQSIKDYWRKWKQDDDSPLSPLSRVGMAANQIGFLWTLAMNPASTISIMMHGPTYAMPVLSTGIGMKLAGPAFARAYREAVEGMSAGLEHGLYIDPRKVGKTPDERQFLARLAGDGDLHAKGADDIRSMGQKAAAIWGEHAPKAKQAADVASSNIGAADQANRVAVALAAYRLARDGNLGAMNSAWAANQVWRAIAQQEGVTPESMGKFLLTQGVGEWGGRSRTEFGRSPLGRMATALHGFQVRFLSNLVKQAFRQGGAGRAAMMWTLAALWAGAGLQGLPFVQDVENAIDAIWKELTGRDPMMAWRLRALLADSGLGKIGAEFVLRGPLSVMSRADFASRLGFGDVITKDVAPLFGGGDESALTFPSIIMGIFNGVKNRAQSHQGAAAAAAPLPAGLRHPAQAAIDAEHGIKSQTGKTTYVPASKMTATEELQEALGLTPLEVTRAREKQDYRYRAQRAHGPRPRDTTP